MKYEKSCGAVLWRSNAGRREYLIILNKKGNATGHWGFPKGHIEPGESEYETATREIREEVGLCISSYMPDFRKVNHYNPCPGVEKDAVYFIAEAPNDSINIQVCELADYAWLSYEVAMERITHDAQILEAAEKYLNKRL